MKKHRFRWLISLLIVNLEMILFVACEPNSKIESSMAASGEVFQTLEETQENKKVENLGVMKLGTLPEMYVTHFDHSIMSFTPCVKNIPIAEDFSNVINFNQYSGFTKNQLKMLYNNGFVVMQPNSDYPYIKMHQVYEGAQYSKVPLFISSDAVFNLYHIFYDESLKALEASQLDQEMKNFSEVMLAKSLEAYNNPDYKAIKEPLKKMAAYYTVANTLFETRVEVPEEIRNLAIEELKLINEASLLTQSPVLGKKLDYSQYKVRGHYTGTSKLSAYFRAMMWYGQVGYEIIDNEQQFNLENAQLSLMMSALILNCSEAMKSWDKVYTATSIYVGVADDLTLYQMQKVLNEVYGKQVSLLDLVDGRYEKKIKEVMLALPRPQITAKLAVTKDINSGLQFRIMGQRYTIDADAMQQLMQSELRPVPSGLDVMATLGSERAYELARAYYKPSEKWEGYIPTLEKLKASCKALSTNAWQSNLYNGWIWALQSATTSFEKVKGMPSFMQNSAWTDKSIHTALGSYAELKHDTVLYAKQPCAEMGGPPENMPYLYVEPNVEVYGKLLSLTQNTKESLGSRDLLSNESKEILERIETEIEMLLSCSKKELTNERFTDEEYYALRDFGGMVDSVSIQLANINLNIDRSTGENYTSALVSDVATILNPEAYLELGSGIPYKIYVICPYQGKLFLAEGAVFSYYEFTADTRLTDEEWHRLLGIEKVNKDGYDYITITAPTEGLKDLLPKWISSFVSMEPNTVTETNHEVIWDNAMLSNNPTPGPDGQYDY